LKAADESAKLCFFGNRKVSRNNTCDAVFYVTLVEHGKRIAISNTRNRAGQSRPTAKHAKLDRVESEFLKKKKKKIYYIYGPRRSKDDELRATFQH